MRDVFGCVYLHTMGSDSCILVQIQKAKKLPRMVMRVLVSLRKGVHQDHLHKKSVCISFCHKVGSIWPILISFSERDWHCHGMLIGISRKHLAFSLGLAVIFTRV
jgi:hypothetical protein